MKQSIKALVFFFVIAAFASIPPKLNLIGHWIISYPDGSKDYVDFNQDGTWRNFGSDGKTLHQGKYRFNNDTLSINDKEGCGDAYWATYQLTFHGQDSVSNAVIEDSCTGRRESIKDAGLRRLKK